MSERINISSGAKWEAIVGYSRAVRVGDLIEVAGTTAVDETGAVVYPGNGYEQTRLILLTIKLTNYQTDQPTLYSPASASTRR